MPNVSAVLTEFLAELDDQCERLTHGFASLEKQDLSEETLNSIYRDTHTIKGSAQLFGCKQMADVAHAMETCLDPLRSRLIAPSSTLVDLLLASLDVIKTIASNLKNTGEEGEMGQSLLSVIPRLAEVVTSNFENSKHYPLKDAMMPKEDLTTDRLLVLPSERTKQPVSETTSPGMEIRMEKKEDNQKEKQDSTGAETIRVQVGLLDNLMNLVGELVLIRNQVVQYRNSSSDDPEFHNLSQRLNVVTTELQNEVMKTRMQPIGNVLSKFHRIVRDMARDQGKEIELHLEGSETELDKTLIEAVKDPLTHIVRNSVDHGIEPPSARGSKPATGTILIRSYHEGGQVVVEISDDGRGLSRSRISEKAVERGLLKESDLERMSDREIHNLIFAPGFSTAEKVSNISGRGVGMDVVRTNIEKIGGMVDLVSTEGKGMTIRLKIPLTLAIVPALVVQSGGERFAIAQVKLVELVNIESHEGTSSALQKLQGQPVFKLRGNLLPLASLNQVLQITEATEYGKNIAVLNADSGMFGLVVDSIEDSTDIVVKPLSGALKNLGIYSGATVLGDGSVSLVLDVIGLAARAQLFGEKTTEAVSQKEKTDHSRVDTEITEYLLVDIGATGKYALPLCLVKRLEEFPRSAIEVCGDRHVVRYRDAILPIVSVSEQLALAPSSYRKKLESETVSIVVVERSGRSIGLSVDAILDVVALESKIDGTIADRPAILGTSIHPEGVVVIIDVYKIAETAFRASPLVASQEGRSSQRVLLVDDNGFFRKHVATILADGGYEVISFVDGEEAATAIEKGNVKDFELIVTDIEMPRLDGYGLARRVRSIDKYKDLPIIALSTGAKKANEQKAKAAGIDQYLEKLNQEQLLNEVEARLTPSKGVMYGT